MSFHPLSPTKCFSQIKRVSLSDSKVNVQEFIRNDEPFVTNDIIENWPAKHWTLESLKKIIGKANVLVAILNKNKMTDYNSFETMPFEQFADITKEHHLSPIEGGLYLIIGNIISNHDRKPWLDMLKDDLKIPSYTPLSKLFEVNLWLGAGGNTSLLHVDPFCNFLTMVQGYKKILLFPPSESKRLYQVPPSKCTSIEMLLHSEIDFYQLDLSRFPKVHEAHYYEIIVGPGETIYIPPGYWHYVVSEDINIAVNIFWHPPLATLLKAPIRRYFVKDSIRSTKKRIRGIFKGSDKTTSTEHA